MSFINQSRIRKYVNLQGKRISKDSLKMFNVFIYNWINKAINSNDGGHKTIDLNLLIALGFPVPKNNK